VGFLELNKINGVYMIISRVVCILFILLFSSGLLAGKLSIEGKYQGKNVFLYNYGLAASDKVAQFQLSGDASGLSENPQNAVKFTLKDITNEMVFSNPISLVICNIEGGEYELVNRLVESSLIKNIEVLLLQFHNIHETSRRDMANIRGLLARTHYSEFKYDFIWDAWVRKDLNKEENDSVTL
jgi:hypothetical protein